MKLGDIVHHKIVDRLGIITYEYQKGSCNYPEYIIVYKVRFAKNYDIESIFEDVDCIGPELELA